MALLRDDLDALADKMQAGFTEIATERSDGWLICRLLLGELVSGVSMRGSKTAERVAFATGWQNATGHYSGRQSWNMERCWEQYQKDTQ